MAMTTSRIRMMTSPLRRRYLDASVFVAFLNEESIPTADGTPRVAVARRILEQAAAGTCRIVTSALSVAEVRIFPGATVAPPAGAGIFDPQRIQVVNLDLAIALSAQALGNAYNLKPPDAIHLATAIRHGCDELLVWDDAFIRRVNRRPIAGLWVGEPY